MDMITLAIVAVIGYAVLKSNILKGGGGGGGMAPTTTPAPDATPETGGADPEAEGGGSMGGDEESEGEYGDEGEGGNGNGNGGGGKRGGKSKGGGSKGGRDRSGYGDRDMDREYSGRGGDNSYGKGSKGKKGHYDQEDPEVCQALIMALIRGVRIPPHILERCENVKIRDISGRYRMPIPFHMTYGMYNYQDPLGYTGLPMSYYRQKYSHSRGRYTTLSDAYGRTYGRGRPYGRSDMYRDAYTTKWGYY